MADTGRKKIRTVVAKAHIFRRNICLWKDDIWRQFYENIIDLLMLAFQISWDILRIGNYGHLMM